KNILNDVDILKSLSENEIEDLYGSSVRSFRRSGELIIKEGESGSSMYVLAEGLLNVFVNESGKERVKVGTISPGQFFGEMSLLTGEERGATVIAETDSVTVEISKEPFKKILKKRPELANALSEVIAERQSINLKKMDDYLNRKESFTAKIAAGIRSFFNLK
ncbi:MAG: cyclic nucleotide-binding domain-containing protein, partial [Melioribacteraceae bacterium]